MNTPPELLRYFVAEAGECLDTLEPLFANVIGPAEGTEVVATGRALRGAATIARLPRLADVAFAIEQVGGGIRDSDTAWTPMLQEALRHTLDELRTMLGLVGQWGPAEDARAAACEASVRRWVPNVSRPTPPMAASSTQPVFIALQASAIASDLDALLRARDTRPVLDEVLSRVRIMQGIAGLQEYPPLSDVCDAIERTSRSIVPDAPLSATEIELFVAAAALLRRASDELRSRSVPDRNSPQVRRFADALSALHTSHPTPERVVNVEELFYHDAGPHVVNAPGAPPMTPARRFADEVVSRAEHVKRLIADARAAGDGIARQRIRRDLASTLHALELTAQSFGAAQVAAFCHEAGHRADQLSPLELDALDAAATLLLTPTASIDELERRVAVLTRRQNTPPATPRVPTPARGVATPAGSGPRAGGTPSVPLAAISQPPLTAGARPPAAPSAASRQPTPTRAPTVTPTGRALQEMLASGIAGLSGLEDQPLSPSVEVPADDDVVPVESLLYRGRAALMRAIQVRDGMRASGTPDAESLRELYDLLDLARTD
ncbi:MAG: Hpt domain-containing protein [Gemmatimonadaceae bacterium]